MDDIKVGCILQSYNMAKWLPDIRTFMSPRGWEEVQVGWCCSECRYSVIRRTDTCPHCGRKIEL